MRTKVEVIHSNDPLIHADEGNAALDAAELSFAASAGDKGTCVACLLAYYTPEGNYGIAAPYQLKTVSQEAIDMLRTSIVLALEHFRSEGGVQ